MNGSKLLDFMFGLLIGSAVGYVAAMLYAPRTGDETRQILSEKSRELRDKAVETVQTTADKTGKAVGESRTRLSMKADDTRNRLQERVSDLKTRGEEVVTDARAQVSEKLHQIADSVDPSDFMGMERDSEL